MKKLMLAAVAVLSFATLSGATRTEALLERLHGPDRTYVFYCMHRGDWRHAPENSRPSILGSIALGADMIELDVRKTKDGHYILSHDPTLDRMTDGTGLIADHTLAEIKQLHLKEFQGGKDAKLTDEHPVTLEEALALTKGKILVNLDKSWLDYRGIAQVLVREGVGREVVMKGPGSMTPDEVKAAFGSDLWALVEKNEILFMPIIYADNIGQMAVFYQWEAQKVRPFAYEFVTNSRTDRPLPYFGFGEKSPRLWLNTMWEGLTGDHTDKRSLKDPDSGWGWCLRQGATMIQTDSPAECGAWLRKIGRHAGEVAK
ncbi:MAG: glycerophosphodiester phosphodiesterase family protein [Kiritimatiellae bacterium]|nr:glycerophosphodiester phosphodiesterase family protein [Kiritimatiellia bacterium]